jgi:serine/threonine protein kinase
MKTSEPKTGSIDEVAEGNEDDTRPANKLGNRAGVEGRVDGKMERQIGKYQVTRRIGCGGMAEVYEVLSSGPGGFAKRLCIKKIRKEVSARQDFVAMFETEARIVSRLQHSNIVQVFEFNRDEKSGDLYLVMEYVDGLDLNTILKEASDLGLQVPLDFAVYVLESLLSALQCAHSLRTRHEPTPVIHRDISPHNLLITTDGVVKLADFGIAKMKGMSDATETGVLKGKLAYMSPEQASGGRVPVTTSSDLFSAGVVFWETVTCERLFKATIQQDILIKVLNFNDASLPYYSPQFNQFLSGLLAHDPMNRFSSAEAALRALRKIGIPPCRKQDAAYLVQRIKILREEEEARILREAGSARETRTTTAPATRPNTLPDLDEAQRESSVKPRRWKPVAAAIGVLFVCALGVWMLVHPKQEKSPMTDADVIERADAGPGLAIKTDVVPENKPESVPQPAPASAVEEKGAPLPEVKSESIAEGLSEAPKETEPVVEKVSGPAPTPAIKKNAEPAGKKPKPKSAQDLRKNASKKTSGDTQDFPMEKIEE